MGLGLGVFLLVVGAILAFAVRDNVNAVDLTLIGYIMMGAGVLSIVVGMVMNTQRSNTSHTEVIDRRDRSIEE